MTDLARLRIRIEAHGDRLRYSPRSSATADVVARMKAHKAELIPLLSSEPPTRDGTVQVWRIAIERLNEAHDGGPVDWQAFNAAEDRFWSATTVGDRSRAAAEMEAIASRQE